MVPAEQAFDGVVLERRADGSVWTHERHEVGVGRFSDVASETAPSVQRAVERYVAALSRDGRSIGGVPVNWRA